MTKKITFLTIVAAVLMMTGCTKESTKTIKATISDYNRDKSEKVYVDDARFSCWNADDGIRFCYGTEAADGTVADLSDDHRTGHIVIPEGAEAPFYAVYPKSAVTGISSTGATVKFESMQIYKEDANGNQIVEAPMAASTQSGTRLDFHNIASLLKVLVPAGTKVTDIYVTTTGDNRPVLWGTGTVTFPVYSNNNSENEGGSKTGETAPTLSSLTASTNAPDGGRTVYLHVNEGSHSTSTSATSESTPPDAYYIVLPPITTGTNFKVSVNYTITANGEKHFYKNIMEQTNGTSTLPANNIGTVDFTSKNFNPTPSPLDPNEHLPGIFSVSSDLKVNFAKGNLAYDINSSDNSHEYTWKFRNNQYTTLPGIPHTSSTSSEFSKVAIGNGVFPDNNGGYQHATFYDWGRFINPENGTVPWFTLNATQWDYLLNNRPVSYARYAFVKVNGKTGLLLFPDEFLWPDNTIPEPSSTSYSSRTNGYTIAEWTALEAAGCVFLTANGYYNHDGTPLLCGKEDPDDDDNPYYNGYYWVSGISGNQITNYLFFTRENVQTTNNTHLQAGYACNIRLVHIAD